jgi:hypothetical protein
MKHRGLPKRKKMECIQGMDDNRNGMQKCNELLTPRTRKSRLCNEKSVIPEVQQKKSQDKYYVNVFITGYDKL